MESTTYRLAPRIALSRLFLAVVLVAAGVALPVMFGRTIGS